MTLATPQGPKPLPSATAVNSRVVTVGTLPITLLVQAAASAAAIAPTVAAPALLAKLGVGPIAIGLYIATVYLTASISSQCGAALVKRWGPIRTSQLSLVLAAVGTLLVAVPSVAVAFLGAVLIGAGYGPITPASSEMLARTTTPRRYALVFSIKQTGVPLGGALVGLIVPVVLTLAGVQWSLIQIAVVCLVGVALAEMLRAQLDALRDPRHPLRALGHLLQPMRMVWAHDALRALALCTLVFSGVQVCLTSYLVSFLNRDLSWSLVAAGVALSVAQVAGVIGRVLWGAIADRLRSARKVLIALVCVMTLASPSMLLLAPDSPRFWVFVLLAIYGSTAVGWNGVFLATVARMVPIEKAATATSGCLFFTYFGVVLSPPLFGVIGSATGSLGLAFALLSVPLLWTLWKLARTSLDTR